MAPSRQGDWRVQRWRDVSAALQDLGRAGIWAQRAPECDPTPPSFRAQRTLKASSPSL